ncbi:MAG: phospho-sugar mutase, partial [Turicibacter sp.]|nr:phospho-sugar mutase [Turicibacter sp.]
TDLTNDSTKVIDLPKSNVLKYTLSDGSWFVLRPSGTEPKAKVYIGVIADVIDAADAQVAKIKEDVLARVNEIIA